MSALCGLVALLVLLPSSEAAAQARTPSFEAAGVERYTLANGLRVILQPDDRQPTVVGLVAYDVGSRDDPTGYSGLGHLVEHASFRGSLNLPDASADAHYATIGAVSNGMVGPDYTIYVAELPAANLAHFLWIESDRMGFTLEALQEPQLAIERSVVANEMRQRGVFQQRIAAEVRRTSTPAGHPYGVLDDEVLDPTRITLDDVRWFFQHHYRPDNATLVLVGKLEVTRTRELIEQYFGPLSALGPRPTRPSAHAIVFDGSQHLSARSTSQLPTLRILWTIPCTRDDVACRVQARLLAAVVDRIVAPQARSAHKARSVDTWTSAHEQHLEFGIVARLSSSEHAEHVLARMDQQVERLRQGRIEPSELRGAQLAFATASFFSQENLWNRAFSWVAAPELLDAAAIDAAMKLGPAEIARLATELLPRDRRFVIDVEHSRKADYEGEIEESRGQLLPRAVDLRRKR